MAASPNVATQPTYSVSLLLSLSRFVLARTCIEQQQQQTMSEPSHWLNI